MLYRAANKTVFSAKYHVVFCPKYRPAVLGDPVGQRLKEIVGAFCCQLGAEAVEVEVMPDHVHLLVARPPRVPLWGFVQLVKGRSSRRLRRESPQLRQLPCPWSPSWFTTTVGGAPLHVVRRYVENQKQAA